MTATDQNWWTVHRTKLTGGPMIYLAANLSKAKAIVKEATDKGLLALVTKV